MKENMRKCLKCGISPVIDPSIKLHRFPRPGRTNILRCELWAKYCFSDDEWSCPKFQMKLWAEHRMLCSRHFSEFAYIDSSKKKLLKHATPSDEDNTFFVKPGPSSLLQGTENIAGDVTACESVIQNRMSDHSYCRSFADSQSHSKDLSPRYEKCKKYIQKIYKLCSVLKNMKRKEMIASLVEDETIHKLSNKISPSLYCLIFD